jgi:subtilase family serine protease
VCRWLFAVAAFVSFASAASNAQTMLTRHVREVTRSGKAQLVGVLPEHQILQLDLVLPLRDQAGLDKLMTEMNNTPPNRQHYLTPKEFTEKFGPTQEDYDTVVRYAESHGLTVIGGSRDRREVQAKGEVTKIQSAFHVNLLTYQHPTENRIFYAPDREPTTDLPFSLWHIAGLDNYSIPHPRYVRGSEDARAQEISPNTIKVRGRTGTGPSGWFLGSDMRTAYYGEGPLTGAGQTLGLMEFLGTDLDDLNAYYSAAKQTNTVPISLLSVDGASTSCNFATDGCDDSEQTLDMIEALGMAPGLANLQVYVGWSPESILSAMMTASPLPGTVSCSWGWVPIDNTELDPYLEQMRAQGQTFFAASGDNGNWTEGDSFDSWPADNAWAVAAGGTHLETSAVDGSWESETAWEWSGGGYSPDAIPLPPYQWFIPNGINQASTVLRNGPDVSANADYSYYICFDQSGCQGDWGGTSFAAPLWAAYTALVNQQIANEGGGQGVGMVNFLFYWWAQWDGNYHNYFHDITQGADGKFAALPGYDLVTGWGSPNHDLLIYFLAGMTTGDDQY